MWRQQSKIHQTAISEGGEDDGDRADFAGIAAGRKQVSRDSRGMEADIARVPQGWKQVSRNTRGNVEKKFGIKDAFYYCHSASVTIV